MQLLVLIRHRKNEKISITRLGEGDQSVTCLPQKCEDLDSILQNHIKSWAQAVYSCNPIAERYRKILGACWMASLILIVELKFRDLVSNIR